MKLYPFNALLARIKYIARWGLMRSSRTESVSEHTADVAILAHTLCVIAQQYFPGEAVRPETVAVAALYHDADEIMTGDLPTPVKYHSPEIRRAYGEVESLAADRLLAMLPADLRGDYAPLLAGGAPGDEALLPLVKAADKISAVIKCIEERKTGNREFLAAEETLRRTIAEMRLPEADVFLTEFLPAYEQSLDELRGEDGNG